MPLHACSSLISHSACDSGYTPLQHGARPCDGRPCTARHHRCNMAARALQYDSVYRAMQVEPVNGEEPRALGACICWRGAAHEGIVAAIRLKQCEAPCMVDAQVSDECVVAGVHQEPHCACVATSLTQRTRSQRWHASTQPQKPPFLAHSHPLLAREQRPGTLDQLAATCTPESMRLRDVGRCLELTQQADRGLLSLLED